MPTSVFPRHGAIAAGHPVTAAAGAEMLRQGGNAVDAAVAATFASFIAEFTLSAPGGGGFALLVDGPRGTGRLYDFFSAAPGLGSTPPAAADIDFEQITVDYGPSSQHFYVGRGSVAVPGNVAGLCALARDAGRLPLATLLEPAVRLAREGCPLTAEQYGIARLIEPILLRTAACRAIFGRPGSDGHELVQPGDLIRMPELAGSLEALGRYGPRLFYRGEIAQAIAEDQATHGGLLTLADLKRYRVQRRQPLATQLLGVAVRTNPPPSRGGLLISFALRLLEGFDLDRLGWGTAAYLELLAEVMRTTSLARRELEARGLSPRQEAPHLLGPASVARWREVLRELLARPVAERSFDLPAPAAASTTQISVVDEDGLSVSLTTSGGEGPGFVVPGTGLILNNMMGEADLHPQGFHRRPAGQRIASMMSPTVVLARASATGPYQTLVTGSGGANRIRSAILQVLLNTMRFGMPLEQAVWAGRIHFEEGWLQVEDGNDRAAIAALEGAGYRVNRWQGRHMFFGGAHSVATMAAGPIMAVGDGRRGGSAVVV
jgi:gamma-glutamyltranspeptidase/glutathione hydrolase